MCVSVDLLVDIFFKSFHIWLYFDLSVTIRQTDRQSRLPLTLVVTDEGNKNNYQRELSCLYKEVMNSMLPPPPGDSFVVLLKPPMSRIYHIMLSI